MAKMSMEPISKKVLKVQEKQWKNRETMGASRCNSCKPMAERVRVSFKIRNTAGDTASE